MSAAQVAAPDPTRSGPGTGAAPAGGPTPSGGSGVWLRRWRRSRSSLLVAAAVFLVALLTALLAPSPARGDLDAESTRPEGSHAVLEILRAQGVSVRQVRTTEDATGLGAGHTLAVVHPNLLGPPELAALAGTGADLVLVEPDLPTLLALAPSVQVAGTVAVTDLPPGCTDPDAVAAGTVTAGGQLYRAVDGATESGVQTCYRQPPGPDAGAASLIRSRYDGRRITVLGQADVLRNASLADQGNAALALRILGAHPELTWLRPDPLAVQQSGRPTLGELLPDWVHWATWQLVLALVVTMLWRARRLGRLVTEPLPVVVRAAEAQEGRARLYRQARARGRAAATLRTAALRRLATRLDTPPEATPEAVAALVAEATGRPGPEITATLLGGAPADDAALVLLAGELDALERAVASADTGPHGTASGSVHGRNPEEQ
ncbi:MAG: DUF4350 domain-containing protein [Kineosporiaceae bacterium]